MIKLSVCLIAGITIGYYSQLKSWHILILNAGLLFIFFALSHILKHRFDKDYLFGVIVCLCTISTGILTVNFHDHSQFPNHYSNKVPLQQDSLYELVIKVREVLKPTLYHDKYIVDVIALNRIKTKGRMLLNLEKDSLYLKPEVDQIIFTNSQIQNINRPLNPHQFNYADYLNKKYIFHQLTLSYENIQKMPASRKSVLGYASQLRLKIQNDLKGYHFQDEELSIINALLLGQRQDISREVYESYIRAGAIHILAVSGLHIGIILLLLQRLFKCLDYLKNGPIIRLIIILIILWSYAIVAGLSASVVRAVTMFTVFAIAMNLKRLTNVYNTIAISVFVLLLFKPNFLFDVGFQLSYLAVLAIVTFEPILRNFWQPKLKVFNFFCRILTVTIAAQIGVVPISLYYFHQFPGLFFVSNLVIIPFLGLILGFGILVVILAVLNSLPVTLASCYGSIIKMMNAFVGWVSGHEAAVFQNISFSIFELFFWYALIILSLKFYWGFTFRNLLYIGILILSFQCWLLVDKKNNSDEAFIIFHKSRGSILGLKQAKKLNIHADFKIGEMKEEKFLSNFMVGEDLQLVRLDSIRDYYIFDTYKLLVVDSLGVYNLKGFKPDIILLRNSPKINLNRLIDSLRPELIISDGSNYRSYQERWARSCELKKIAFHQTGQKGAYLYRF